MQENYIWLDNASTTEPKFFGKDYSYYWFNPNSNHKAGVEARKELDKARERIKESLGLKSGKVLFCRCASEAIEWLCRQFYQYGDNLHTYASPYDHDSVINNCCDIEDIEECIKWKYLSRNYIYFHQYTNHVTGIVFDIESIGKQVQTTGTFFGSDITASIGHYPLPDNLDEFCDFLYFSGRKIHCETMGAMWLSDRLFKYLGGNQDSRNGYTLLSGTPNTGGAIALSYAVKHAVENVEKNQERFGNLVNYMCTKLLENNILHHIYGIENNLKTHAINALYLPNLNADSLVQYLSSQNIFVSPCYSACSNEANYRTAEVLGMTREQASQTIRVSFCEDTTEEHIDKLVDGIVKFKGLFV